MAALMWRTSTPGRPPGLELGSVFIGAPALMALFHGEDFLTVEQRSALEAEDLFDHGPTDRLRQVLHTVLV
jgi:hypothetical protein